MKTLSEYVGFNVQWKHIIIGFYHIIMIEVTQQDCIIYYFHLLHTKSVNTKCIVGSIKSMQMRFHLYTLSEIPWGHANVMKFLSQNYNFVYLR